MAVKDGVVTLTDWVDSYTKRWAAESATHRVRGVKAVANDIEVRLPRSAERTDADIAAAAIRALEWDAFVSVDKLEVTVSKGWVTLKGEVECTLLGGEGRGWADGLVDARGLPRWITRSQSRLKPCGRGGPGRRADSPAGEHKPARYPHRPLH